MNRHITRSLSSSASATGSSSSSSNNVCRSTYVANLRRAFFLRSHPDRFRNADPKIQNRQSALLSALSNRFTDKDFHDYALNVSSSTLESACKSVGGAQQPMSYYLESRNGLLHLSLNLNNSVFDILQSMSAALESTGAASLPPPPPPTSMQSNGNSTGGASQNQTAGWQWAQPSSSSSSSNTNHTGSSSDGIDDRYNVNTNRGRDIHAFLNSITLSEIEERRAARMDVTAAALIARRLYSFQSIDGIRLGWSSPSFAKLLHALILLHEEYSSKFKVQSFYPLRLVFSPDDDAFHFFHKHNKYGNNENNDSASSTIIKSLDVFGGNFYLNPAATQLEWLEALQEVTDDNLSLFMENRELMKVRTAFLFEEMGIKVRKGHSCSSWEYHAFLGRIVEPLIAYNQYHKYESDSDKQQQQQQQLGTDGQNPHLRRSSSSLVSTSHHSHRGSISETIRTDGLVVSSVGLRSQKSSSQTSVLPVQLVVESPIACRRPVVTSQGNIRISSDVGSISDLLDIISRLSEQCQRQWSIEQTKLQDCKDAINQIKWELGVQRVYRVGTMVQHDHFIRCMSRILKQRNELREKLSGQTLGIAGSGQRCHIADDGSIVLPHDWT